jgi:hypothetical protein
MEIEKIISEFKNLKLSDYPEKEIKDLFNKVGNIATMLVTFDKGKSVMRARPNYNGERFCKKSDLSFKPEELNKTYQRASSPYQTMFYASSIPERTENGELDNARVIGVSETIPMLRNKEQSGFQKISFGRWYAEEDLKLIAIIHEKKFHEGSSYLRELIEVHQNFIKDIDKEVAKRSTKILNFLASEFSKKEINGDYDYMISAIFTENMVKNGLDGVIYPSVRTAGKGFNIAISPNATKKLGLYVAGECSIYKLKDQVVIGNDAIIELDGKQNEFTLKEIENHQKECLEKLGVKSINELK